MIIVGNLKMNMSYDEVVTYESKIRELDVIICPSYLYLPIFNQGKYHVCAQNVCEYDNGPYTGEVSASQIKSLGVNYVLIGHSERRHVFNESQPTINHKIIQALKNNLKIIYCVGETWDERNNDKSLAVIHNQITSAFDGLTKEEISNIIIGYEPVWAISDGVHPSAVPDNNQIEEVNNYIKKIIRENHQLSIPVLYGGSVNEKNIDNLLSITSHDGFLVGGASKNIEEFLSIYEKCK